MGPKINYSPWAVSSTLFDLAREPDLRVVASYVMSLILKRLFLFKCNVQMLRLTTLMTLLALPIVLTRLLCYHKRVRPPSSILAPTSEAVVLSTFPIAWFFGFLYYTDVPSVVFVVWTIIAQPHESILLPTVVSSSLLELATN